MVDDMDDNGLTTLELARYTRHLSLPQLGYQGQLRLKQASVLVVGLGGLGSVSALYLTLAGLGRVGLIDDDQVSLSNLHRQILYTTSDLGESKLAIAADRLLEHNPEVDLITFPQRFNMENAQSIVQGFDLVIDGTDNFKTRQLINQICADLDKPYIFGAVNLFDGQVSVFHASQGPCLACIFSQPAQPEQEKQAEQLAVLNTLPAVIGALQATEALKIIVGIGKPLIGQLLIYNALNAALERVNIKKNPNCRICGR